MTLGALLPEELLYGRTPIAGTPFHRGDANDDGELDITDVIFTLTFLFLGGATPPSESSNIDDDGMVNITDGIYLLNYLFLGGPPPLPPGPLPADCGVDPAGSVNDLGCDRYAHC